MTLLAVRELTRNFGGLIAVDTVTFDVAPGTVHAVIGPNGAGKTTLFNLITGIYRPTRGQVHLGGEDLTGFSPSALAQRGLSRTFQNLQLFFNMSAIENVMVGAHLHCETRLIPSLLRLGGMGESERVRANDARRLMADVGLESYVGAEVSAMPYGALKRLEIARALASRPRILLLDEPAAGLNPAESREIGQLIRRIVGEGVTVVLVEHNMRLVMEVSDRVSVLDRGRLLAEGTTAEIRANSDVIRAYLGTRSAAGGGGTADA
ncbi:MAG: ABC transporter ATP-binding protein [Alphaproteobacteria bacterium]|nr:ABC transporter ATP-binding protein [Alphaproteobacteria bacterium]